MPGPETAGASSRGPDLQVAKAPGHDPNRHSAPCAPLLNINTAPVWHPNVRGRLTQQPHGGVIIIPSDKSTYLERLLKFYLRLGIIEEKWIPQIKQRLAETGKVFIPEQQGVTRLRDPVEFSIKHTLQNGTTIRVYPITEKPWATFLLMGEVTDGPLKGLCMWMPEAFFSTHGRDGLPLDL